MQGRMSGQAKSNELQYTAIPNSNENRDPVMRTGIPCNENRYFPVGIDSQGVPCEPYSAVFGFAVYLILCTSFQDLKTQNENAILK